MAKIRVDPAILTSNSSTISSTASNVSAAGKLAQSAALTAPSYSGQFGPRVKAIGAEAMARAQSTTGSLNNSAFSLNTRANAFLNADKTYIKGPSATLVSINTPPLPPRIAETDVVEIEKGVDIDQEFAWAKRGVTTGGGIVDVIGIGVPSTGVAGLGQIGTPIKMVLDIVKDFINYSHEGWEKLVSAITVDLIIDSALFFLGILVKAAVVALVGLIGITGGPALIIGAIVGVIVSLILSFIFEIPAVKAWKDGVINSLTDGIKQANRWIDDSFNNAINSILTLPRLPGFGLFNPISESINAIRWAPFI